MDGLYITAILIRRGVMYAHHIKIEYGRETDPPREKDVRIELSDREHADRLEAAKFVYKPPSLQDIPPEMLKKYQIAKKLTEETKVIKIKGVEKNEKSKSKIPKKGTKKVPAKSKPTAVESIQEELS
jgi:hypothetical protein